VSSECRDTPSELSESPEQLSHTSVESVSQRSSSDSDNSLTDELWSPVLPSAASCKDDGKHLFDNSYSSFSVIHVLVVVDGCQG